MFKLITDNTFADNQQYKPPSFFIQKNISYPPSYFIKKDPYVSFLAKEEIILIVLDYVEQIKFLVRDLEETLKAYNQQQVNYILQNLKDDAANVDLLCNYDKGIINTNKGAEAIANVQRIVNDITVIINKKLELLNKKFNNVFSYYDGNYTSVQSFADNLVVENQALPLSYFEGA